jgi:hypothetical protein
VISLCSFFSETFLNAPFDNDDEAVSKFDAMSWKLMEVHVELSRTKILH